MTICNEATSKSKTENYKYFEEALETQKKGERESFWV